MARAQVRRRRPETVRCAGGKILYEDVRALEQLREHAGASRLLDVERQRLLGSIQPDEVTRQSLDRRVVTAREIAAVGPLDLDHARAEIGELPRRERRGDRLFERYNGDV